MTDGALRVELLGDPRAWLGDEPVTLGPARQRAVFAVLATRAGQVVPRGELVEAVWGTSPPASAAGSLHTYVSGLRRVLEPGRPRWSPGEVLVSEPQGYRLRLDHLDLRTFAELRERAAERARAGEHRATVELLDDALALWRGEPFAGVPGPFAERQRTRFTDERHSAVEERARARLALGEHAEPVLELTALVAAAPLRESAWVLLVTALYRGGRHAEALHVIARMRAYFRAELGAEPGAAVRALHQRLLATAPEPADLPHEPARERELLAVVPARAADPGPVAERDAARLRGYLDGVLVGRGRAVLVEGEPGSGKSALLAEVLGGAGRLGCHVAWAVAGRPRPPLGVVAEALGAPAPATRKELLERVDALCATAPLVLVVDDLQHADDASLLLWHQLAVATRLLPLLLVGTCPPGEGGGRFGKLRDAVLARDGELVRVRSARPASRTPPRADGCAVSTCS
ncbi:AfsR/SARP family transcriptional regulator [Actinophytocola xanthii]|uniref:AfsR/SARP family transcriptional regulator n=1 Tax=Actinophytocola xanthii TaxID=1912961 RepID=UPI001300EDF0|nr:AfsR/SARP family transcriptional regulator [Actinophytocola xanthii]